MHRDSRALIEADSGDGLREPREVDRNLPAIRIVKGLDALGDRIFPPLAALLAGGASSIASAAGLANLLGADAAIVGGFYAKSVTAPIAMGVHGIISAVLTPLVILYVL